MAVVFLLFLFATPIPAKGRFFARALVALVIATLLAHLNRWTNLWPGHPYFVSGHLTFCLGIALSLGMLRRWTLAITLPLLVPFGTALVRFHFHTVQDVLGAIPLVLVVYGVIHLFWKVQGCAPPLDTRKTSA